MSHFPNVDYIVIFFKYSFNISSVLLLPSALLIGCDVEFNRKYIEVKLPNEVFTEWFQICQKFLWNYIFDNIPKTSVPFSLTWFNFNSRMDN